MAYDVFRGTIFDNRSYSLVTACGSAKSLAKDNPGVECHVERVAGDDDSVTLEAKYTLVNGRMKAWIR